MFSSSLLGVMYRPTIAVVKGPDNRTQAMVNESLLSRLAAFLGVTKRHAIPPQRIIHHDGFCFLVPIPENFVLGKNEASRLELYENGRRLPHSHSIHEDIRFMGLGRFSHWDENLLFSSSDNTDPSTNGRRYEIVRP